MIEENIYIDNSNIHGLGIFTNTKIIKNQYICDAIINNKITPLASKINHCSNKFNVDLEQNEKGDYYFIALKDINKSDEIVINYKSDKVPNFINKNIDGFNDC